MRLGREQKPGLAMRVSKGVTLPDGRFVRGYFDPLTIFLHWTTVVLVLFQLANGWAMSELDALATIPSLVVVHRSTGVMIWIVALLRLLWRKTFATFPTFPPNMRRSSKWAAQATEYLLYFLLLAQPLTGALYTLLRGRSFDLVAMTIPPLLARNSDLSEQFHQLHILGAYAFATIVGGHAMAALLHHFVRRDDVLEAMAPILRRTSTSAALDNQVLQDAQAI